MMICILPCQITVYNFNLLFWLKSSCPVTEIHIDQNLNFSFMGHNLDFFSGRVDICVKEQGWWKGILYKVCFIFCLKKINFQSNEINCMCMWVHVDVWRGFCSFLHIPSVFHDPKNMKSHWCNVKTSTSWGFLEKNKHGRWKCAKC